VLVDLIQIGNSRGIRLPKKVIDECHLDGKVMLSINGQRIILESAQKKPRYDWEKQAKEMHQNGDDELLIPDVFEDEELLEW